MTMKKLTLYGIGALVIALVISAAAVAAEGTATKRALWLRAASISPDGTSVAFSFHGDIWTVPSTGGAATPLTVSPAYDTSPIWSADGKKIAFASDRYGNFDVFVMPSSGGEAQ